MQHDGPEATENGKRVSKFFVSGFRTHVCGVFGENGMSDFVGYYGHQLIAVQVIRADVNEPSSVNVLDLAAAISQTAPELKPDSGARAVSMQRQFHQLSSVFLAVARIWISWRGLEHGLQECFVR